MTDQNSTSPDADSTPPAAGSESPAIDFGSAAPEAPAASVPDESAAVSDIAAGIPETPAAPAYEAPAAPAYEAPAAPAYETPAAPAYGAPQPPAYGAPGYGAPQAPGYGAPQAPGYGAAPGYAQAPAGPARPEELSDLTLNLWLTVFFGWLPALIFWVTKKDTATPLIRKALTDNLNWTIVAAIIYVASYILTFVLIGLVGLLIPFVFGIIHAVTVPNQIRAGQPGKFYMAPNWVK